MDTSPQCLHLCLDRSALPAGTSSFGMTEKGGNMKTSATGTSVRQRVTRVLATGALLGMYAFGMVAPSGAFVVGCVSPAFAHRGRGRGWGGGGGGGGRGRVAVAAPQAASASAQPSSAVRSQRAP